MGILGVINSDQELQKTIASAFRAELKDVHDARHLSGMDEILEFINYNLPELVIINFSDPLINIEEIAAHIRNDPWILNFGIIGIFSSERDDEQSLHEKYKGLNLLTLLDTARIRSHLVKNIQIVEENVQVIFQRDFSKKFLDGASGAFIIENDILAIPLYASIGATMLAQRGLINPDSKMHLQLALGELIVNAVEHGNCGISYDEKTRAMDEGMSVVEMVAEKCKDPAVRAKKVEFLWEIQREQSVFIIRDEGQGFNVKAHLKKIAQQDQMSLHGRGIKMALLFSHTLGYNEKGNQVTLAVRHDPSVENDVPLGFSREQVLNVKPGDLTILEGEASDCLYYISSGTYTVLHDQKPVGSLSPQDIFMGEMSFLLDQKRSASVRAETPGKLIRLTRKTFIQIIREYPHYGLFLSKLLARRLLRSNDQNARLTEKIQPPVESPV